MRFTIKLCFALLILLSCSLSAKDIEPTFILTSKGFVNDFVFDNALLYVANDEGSVEVFDLNSRKLINEIALKPELSAKGEWVNPKILSVDRHNGKTLFVSTNQNGYREVWMKDADTLHHLITAKDKATIKKARFIDDERLLFGTMSYEMILYTRNDDTNVYKNHVEESAFSDMQLSIDKSIMITASESGQVTLSDVKTGRILKQLNSLNVDNIYKVAYKDGTIITAGQDRRVGVYPSKGEPYYIKSDFLVYSVTISPDGKTGIYSSGEANDLQLFDIKTKNKTDRLIGHEAIPSITKYFDKYGVFSAGYENKIYYWHLEDTK